MNSSPSSGAQRLLVLAGPTAVGKSEIALLLAERLGGEIVSVDSMQVYRGMDIGTAKPSAEERARVPHHLLDVAEVIEPFDAARFVQLARTAVAGIFERGKVPILCGGTGLYLKAFLSGLDDTPTDPALRAELEHIPLEELLRELQERDPAAYERIDRQNPRRVIRAVEVIRLTGKPFFERRGKWEKAEANLGDIAEGGAGGRQLIGFSRRQQDLRKRIDARVETMFREGLVAETRQLLERGLEQNRNAMQGLGYRQVVEHLRGERGLPETIELVKSRTRKFAKRQMTWFRRQMKLEWIELQSGQNAADLAEELAKGISDRSSGNS